MRSATVKTMLAGIVFAAILAYVTNTHTTLLQFVQSSNPFSSGDNRYAADARACLMYAPQKPDTVYFAGCGGFF